MRCASQSSRRRYVVVRFPPATASFHILRATPPTRPLRVLSQCACFLCTLHTQPPRIYHRSKRYLLSPPARPPEHLFCSIQLNHPTIRATASTSSSPSLPPPHTPPPPPLHRHMRWPSVPRLPRPDVVRRSSFVVRRSSCASARKRAKSERAAGGTRGGEDNTLLEYQRSPNGGIRRWSILEYYRGMNGIRGLDRQRSGCPFPLALWPLGTPWSPVSATFGPSFGLWGVQMGGSMLGVDLALPFPSGHASGQARRDFEIWWEGACWRRCTAGGRGRSATCGHAE